MYDLSFSKISFTNVGALLLWVGLDSLYFDANSTFPERVADKAVITYTGDYMCTTPTLTCKIKTRAGD